MIHRYFTVILATVAIGLFGTLANSGTESSGAKTVKPAASPKQAAPAVADTTAKINWMQFDLGLAKAKKEKKHMFVDFTTAWCGWCKKMEAETFSRPEVIKYVNDNFIAAKVIGDSDKELDIDGYKISERNLTTSSFQVSGFPSFAFLTPEGQVIPFPSQEGKAMSFLSGYRPTENMKMVLEFVKEYKYDTSKATPSTGNNSSEKK